MAEPADAHDSKSCGLGPWGFDSPLRHHLEKGLQAEGFGLVKPKPSLYFRCIYSYSQRQSPFGRRTKTALQSNPDMIRVNR